MNIFSVGTNAFFYQKFSYFISHIPLNLYHLTKLFVLLDRCTTMKGLGQLTSNTLHWCVSFDILYRRNRFACIAFLYSNLNMIRFIYGLEKFVSNSSQWIPFFKLPTIYRGRFPFRRYSGLLCRVQVENRCALHN